MIATVFPLASAPRAISAISLVLPQPVGIWSIQPPRPAADTLARCLRGRALGDPKAAGAVAQRHVTVRARRAISEVRSEGGARPSCDAAFRFNAVETLEEINARDDAGAELAKMNLDS